MNKMHTRGWFVIWLVSSMAGLFLTACESDEGCPPAIELPEAVTISGRVIAIGLTAQTPVSGAIVELEDGSIVTTSGADGFWMLEDVPTGQDPLIKITAGGSPFRYPTAYNSFPLSLGLVQYDLQILDPILSFLLVLEDVLAGADPAKLCLMFGAAVGFASMDYPQVVEPLEGATVIVTPAGLTVHYLNETGLADPTLTATSSLGAFYVVVPDATVISTVGLSGTNSEGKPLAGSPAQPTRPGSFIPAGLIDPFYVP